VTLHIRTADPASEELEAAVRWYETQRRGLGAEFYAAMVDCLDRIKAHPESGVAVFGDPEVRRALVTRFPYQVVYRLRSSDLLILAFAHLRRRPGFWKHRS